MFAIALVVSVGAIVVAGLWVWGKLGRSQSRTGEVMPSHYESLLHAEARHYPGLCPACRTANDPDYQFCRECGERLSEGSTTTEERELGHIFDQGN